MVRFIEFVSSALAAAFVVLLIIAAGVGHETIVLANENLSDLDCELCECVNAYEVCHVIGSDSTPNDEDYENCYSNNFDCICEANDEGDCTPPP